jgi:hypothetical protein
MQNRIYYRTLAGARGFIPCGPIEECERLINAYLNGGVTGRVLVHSRPDDPGEEILVTDETGALIAAYRFVQGDGVSSSVPT